MNTMPFAEAHTLYNEEAGQSIVCIRVGRVPNDENLYLTITQAAELVGLVAVALAEAVAR